MSIQIIQETPHLLAINKPCGWTVEYSPHFTSIEEWARKYVAKQTKKPLVGIIHRLDRPVSGVLILAKKKIALKQLNEAFRLRKVRKTYLAIVNKAPHLKSKKIQHWLIKDQKNKKAIICSEPEHKAVEVTLHYRIVEEKKDRFLLEIHPYTGKYHQIRAQLAAIGCPILGDVKYGGQPLPKSDTIALHAHRLSFHYPFLDEQHTFEVSPPEEGWWL